MNATPTRPWINGYWEYRAMANEECEDYQRRAQW